MGKQYLSAEQIADKAERFNGTRNTAEINRLYRQQDESHLYPIRGRFNATDRAIRRIRRLGFSTVGLEYALNIDSELSRIVNSEV